MTADIQNIVSLSPSQASPRSGSPASPSPGLGTSERQLAAIDASADEDDDDGGDQERLEEVKGMLFDTYRVQNRDCLALSDYISDLNFVFSETREDDEDQRNLYHTLLNMQV